MIVTGRPVGAHEAQQMGLANRVVPVGESLTVAHDLAEQVGAFPSACVRAATAGSDPATGRIGAPAGVLAE